MAILHQDIYRAKHRKNKTDNSWSPFEFRSFRDRESLGVIEKLWELGELRFLLSPVQKEMWEYFIKNESMVLVGCTSRQLGKSSFGIIYGISQCLKYPNYEVRFAAPTHKQANMVANNQLRKVLQSCPKRLFPDTQGDSFNFKNGSRLIIVGCHDRGVKLRGDSADLIILDEVRDLRDAQSVIEDVLMPIISTRNGKLLMLSTPPDSPSHTFTTKWIADAIANYSFFKADYKRNPFVDRNFMNKIIKQSGEDSPTFRREYLADYTAINTERAVLPSYKKQNQIENILNYKRSRENKLFPYVGIDLGQMDRTAIVFAIYDELQNIVIIVDEWAMRGPLTNDIAEAIIYKEKEAFYGLTNEPVRISDIDHRFINDIRSNYGLSIRQVRKTDRISMIARLNDAIFSCRTFIDTEKCQLLDFECSTTIWNESRSDYVVESEHGGHGDLIDALKYLEISVNRAVEPQPTKHIIPDSIKRAFTGNMPTKQKIDRHLDNRLSTLLGRK